LRLPSGSSLGICTLCAPFVPTHVPFLDRNLDPKKQATKSRHGPGYVLSCLSGAVISVCRPVVSNITPSFFTPLFSIEVFVQLETKSFHTRLARLRRMLRAAPKNASSVPVDRGAIPIRIYPRGAEFHSAPVAFGDRRASPDWLRTHQKLGNC
jgi:hypothetical protein